MDAREALERLVAGNRRFAAGRPEGPNRGPERRRETALQQRPFAAVLTCSDSRVIPSILFDWGIGDLFVVRTAGNLLDAVARASLEFAVASTGVPLVVVLGHTRCGAVRAALDDEGGGGHLACLFEALAPAVEAGRGAPGDAWRNAVVASAERTAAALRFGAGAIARGVAEGRVVVLSGCYDLETGEVELFAAADDEPGRGLLNQVTGPGAGGSEAPRTLA